MRKCSKVLVTALCAALVLSSAGCGKKSDSKADDTSKVSSDSSSSNSSAPESDNKDVSVSSSDKDTEKKPETIDFASLDYSVVKIADYSKIALDTAEIDSNTEAAIKSSIESTGDYKKVKKGKVELGDTVSIFYVGKVDGKKFDGGSYTKEDNKNGFALEIGSKSFIDGFEDALIGKEIGGTYDINVNFPESYPQNTDLEGKPAVFTVTINYKQQYPEKLTDAFVKKNFKDFEKGYKNTASDYTKYIRDKVISNMAWSKVYNDTEITEYQQDILETIKLQKKAPLEYSAKMNGLTLNDYIASQQMSKKDFEELLTERAEEDLKKRYIMGYISDKENIGVDKKEYDKMLAQYIKDFACEDEKALDEILAGYLFATAQDLINNEILYNNVKELLISNVDIVEK